MLTKRPRVEGILKRRRRCRRVGVEALEVRALLATVNQMIVEDYYQFFLDRAAEPAGLAAWTSALDLGASAEAVGLLIADSPEARADDVNHAFQTYLGRAPTSDELGQDVAALGVVTPDVLSSFILGSAEFLADSGGSDAGFINALYKDVLGRNADAAGAAAWGGALAAGVSRATVAYDFLTSQEASQDEVTSDYEEALGRAPDPAGLAAWTSAVDTMRVTSPQVVDDLVDSPESVSRISQIVAPSIAPSPAVANSVITQAYQAWKAQYVTSQGAGGFLRVQRPENGNDTVSEGIGYGMIMAAYMGDQTTFNGLWNYAKSHFDANGLMNWRIDANNNTVGFNAATDGDEDMAIALIVADKKWGGYTADAKALIGNIMAHEIEPGTFVVKPGDVFGGSSLLNPSYFAPAYYTEFATYTGNTSWNSVTNEVYTVLGAINAKNGGTGLVPDWCTAAGNSANGQGYNYTYDATRTPWRLATAYAWTADPRAKAQLNMINTFFQGVGITNVKDGYTITGSVTGQYHNASFVAPAASASLASTNTGYQTACWNETVALTNGNYYNDSLRLLGLMLMGGVMTDPP